MKQRVTIIGPNLRNQSKGQYHVHAEGCLDVMRDPHRYGYHHAEPHRIIEAASKVEIVNDVYGDVIAAAYFDEFNFAPCVKLPKYPDAEELREANASS